MVLLLSACGDAAGPAEDRIVAGVNLTALFAPPTSAEIAQVLDDWSGRDVSAQGVAIVKTSGVTVGGGAATVHIVSHTVGGVRHYGAILVPSGASRGSLPVLVVTHGGDHGVNLDDALVLLGIGFGDARDDFVFVVPAFRSEPLVFEGTRYLSEGEPSPWDRDVDDALALLSAAIDVAPAADAGRLGVLGFSRGACVALLMAIRDPRIDVLVEFSGPTDFFGAFAQEVATEALLGRPPDLPGVDYLNARLIQPLKNGALTIQDVRPELLRRSPVYFADRLPQLQVHHGTADDVVPVGEARRLIEVMRAQGRRRPEFESYLYAGGGHDASTLPGSIERTIEFLGRLTAQALLVVLGRH